MPKPSKRQLRASMARGSVGKKRKDDEENESDGGGPVKKRTRDLSGAVARILQENVEPRGDDGIEGVVAGIESRNVGVISYSEDSVDRVVKDVCPNVCSLTKQAAYGSFVTQSVPVSRGDGQQKLTRFFPRAERVVETVDRILDRDETESLDSSFISEGGFSALSRYSGGSNTSARLAEKAEKRRLAAVRAVEVVSAPVSSSSRKRSRKVDRPTNPYLVLEAEDDETNWGESGGDDESSVVDDSSFISPSSFVVTRKRGRCSTSVGVIDDASFTTSMTVVKAKRSRNELIVDDRSSMFGGSVASSMEPRCSARIAARQRRDRNVLSSSISVGKNTRAWVESAAVPSGMNRSFSDLSLEDEERVEEVSDSRAEETAAAVVNDNVEYCSRLHRLVNRFLNPADWDDRIQMCLCTDEDNPVSSGMRFQEGDFTQAELRVLVENDGDEWLEANLVYEILLSNCYGENSGDMVVLDPIVWEPHCMQMAIGERPIDRALNYMHPRRFVSGARLFAMPILRANHWVLVIICRLEDGYEVYYFDTRRFVSPDAPIRFENEILLVARHVSLHQNGRVLELNLVDMTNRIDRQDDNADHCGAYICMIAHFALLGITEGFVELKSSVRIWRVGMYRRLCFAMAYEVEPEIEEEFQQYMAEHRERMRAADRRDSHDPHRKRDYDKNRMRANYISSRKAFSSALLRDSGDALSVEERKALQKEFNNAEKALKSVKVQLGDSHESYMSRYKAAYGRMNELKNRLRPKLYKVAFGGNVLPDDYVFPDVSVVFDRLCEYCGALRKTPIAADCEYEKPGFCCVNGKILIEDLPPAQPFLQSLFDGVDKQSKHFLRYVKNYNNALAGARFNAKVKLHGLSSSSLCVTGTCQQTILSLFPRGELCSNPTYNRLYFFDTREATDKRYGRNTEKDRGGNMIRVLDKALLEKLDVMLRRDHVHIKSMVNAYDCYKEEVEKAEREGRSVVNYRVRSVTDCIPAAALDKKQYEQPATSDIVATFNTTEEGFAQHTHFTVREDCGGVGDVQLHCTNSRTDCLVYPLFFPRGTETWHPGLRRQGVLADGRMRADGSMIKPHERITLQEYTAYMFCEKGGDRGDVTLTSNNNLLHGQTLTQQRAVDVHVRNEDNKLDYVRSNKQEQRRLIKDDGVKLLEGLNVDKQKIGFSARLPSSHTGSPAWFVEKYQDTMAMVLKHGMPSLFITFTCDKDWNEFESCIRKANGETIFHRPDMGCRIAYGKWGQFEMLMRLDQIFGRSVGYVWREEAQQCGLLHYHSVWWIDEADMPKTEEGLVDKVAWADMVTCAVIPDKLTDPECYKLVQKFMIHGPCGVGGRYDRCQKYRNGGKKKCNRHFPKDFADETVLEDDKLPVYRRPRDGRLIATTYGVATNQFVVPYNRFLLMTFKCHINVEIPTGYSLMKYLFKYIYKENVSLMLEMRVELKKQMAIAGGDKTKFDEIAYYQNSRSIGSMEAMARNFGFPLARISDSVESLIVHDEGGNLVYTSLNGNARENLANALNRNSMLEAYFELNKVDPFARTLLYEQVPEFYTWQPNELATNFSVPLLTNEVNVGDLQNEPRPCLGVWRMRANRRHELRKTVRLCHVFPSDIERFYLRILLTNVKGATSFKDIRTIPGESAPCESYKEACVRRGICVDDQRWSVVLREIAARRFPRTLRSVFVSLLMNCEVLNVAELWEEFKDELSHDFRSYKQNRYEKALREIDRILQYQNRRNKEVHLPEANYDLNIDDFDEEGEDIVHQAELGKADEKNLNNEQRSVLKAVERALLANPFDPSVQRLFYLQGAAGAGKTFLLKCITRLMIGRRISIVVAASTGIAATLLHNGRTAHITFALPLNATELSMSNLVRHTSVLAKSLEECKVIIIDEISMLHRHYLRIIDQLLRDLCPEFKKVSFGGKILLLGGDFKQVLPIVKGSAILESIQASFICSDLWPKFKTVELKENVRTGNNYDYARWLNDLGMGALNDIFGNIEVPPACIAHDEKDLLDFLYDFETSGDGVPTDVALLSPYNVEVDRLNEIILNRWRNSDAVRHYYSVDSHIDGDLRQLGSFLPIGMMHRLIPSGFPPHELKLKIGAIVIMVCHIYPKDGVVNGTRIRIIEMPSSGNIIYGQVLTGRSEGKVFPFFRIDFKHEESGGKIARFVRHQYPFRLAFAMSFNKAQGQTFRRVGLCLKRSVFQHGQLYVAFSRVPSFDSVKVFNGKTKPGDKMFVRNVVFDEVVAHLKQSS